MGFPENKTTDKWVVWARVADILFYLFALAMIVVFFLTRHTAPWAFLYVGGVALIARVASYIIRHNKR